MGAAAVLLALAGCSEGAPPPVGDDVLVLELGGGHPLLGASLQRIAPASPSPSSRAAPSETARADAPPPPPPAKRDEAEDHGQVAQRADGAEGADTLAPDPAQRVEPAPRYAELQRGETIYGLARQHLGSGARWRELLALNGWSEEQARSLRAGTRVKLPRR